MTTQVSEESTSPQPPGRRRPWKRWLTWGALASLVLFGLIQLVPFGHGKNPPVTRAAVWPSAQAQSLAENGCYDCHSNLTKRWWATKVAPASWLAQNDVNGGRNALDFSEWDRPQAALDEVVEAVQSGSHATVAVQALPRQRAPRRRRASATRRRAPAALRDRPARGHHPRRRLTPAACVWATSTMAPCWGGPRSGGRSDACVDAHRLSGADCGTRANASPACRRARSSPRSRSSSPHTTRKP